MSVRTVWSRKPSVTTAWGGGRRNRRWVSRTTYVAKYHPPITSAATASGGTTTPRKWWIPRVGSEAPESTSAGSRSSRPTSAALEALRAIDTVRFHREVPHRIGDRVHDLDVLGRE